MCSYGCGKETLYLGLLKNKCNFRYMKISTAFGLLIFCRGKVVAIKSNTKLIRFFNFELLVHCSSRLFVLSFSRLSWCLRKGETLAVTLDVTFAVILLQVRAPALVTEHIPTQHLPGNNCFLEISIWHSRKQMSWRKTVILSWRKNSRKVIKFCEKVRQRHTN